MKIMAEVEDDNLETIAVVAEGKLPCVASVRSNVHNHGEESRDDNPECLGEDIGAKKAQFDSVNLDEVNSSSDNIDDDGDDEDDGEFKDNKQKRKRLKKKKSKHILIEDDSSSDDEEKRPTNPTVNPSDLTWLLWMWYYVRTVSSGALKAAEFLGERLASFFGITTPKYQYVIDEYYRIKQLEREEEEKEKKEEEFVAQRKMEELSKMEGGGSEELVYNNVSSSTAAHAVPS